MNIGVIQRFLPSRSRGGVGHFTHGLCNALVERGHTVTVFSQDPLPSGGKYRVVTLQNESSPARKYCAPLLFALQVRKQDFSGLNVICAQGDDFLISRLNTPPIVRTMHGSALAEAIHNGLRLYSPKRFFMHLYFYFCELISDLRADAVVAVSKDTCRYYPRIYAVIPNGLDLERFSALQAKKAPKPTVLFVGEMRTRKRGCFLLKTIQECIRPRLPDVELWLVCPEKIEGRGIKWFGQVNTDTLIRLYQEAWVFCLPSSYEGFGRSSIEAMAAGTPVVATVNPGSEEVLGHGRYGFLVSDGELGAALYTLLTREDLRQEYSRRGLERAQDYSWQKVAEQYEQVYQEVIRKRTKRSHAL